MAQQRAFVGLGATALRGSHTSIQTTTVEFKRGLPAYFSSSYPPLELVLELELELE